MTREELVNSREYLLRKAAADWCFSSVRGLDEIDAFEAGADWQFEQFENNRLSSCDKQTKEEAEREEAFVISFIKENNRPPTFSDAIERTRKQTIEKACEWLKRNTILAETTIERFKQTMEE